MLQRDSIVSKCSHPIERMIAPTDVDVAQSVAKALN